MCHLTQVILTSIISYNSLKLDPASLRLEMEAVSRDLVARQVGQSTIEKSNISCFFQDARRPPSLASLLRAPPLRLQVSPLYILSSFLILHLNL